MEFRLSKMLTFLTLTTLVGMASHAAAVRQPLPQLSYWNSVLPNTPIPKAFRELIHPGVPHLYFALVYVAKSADLVSKNFLRPAGTENQLDKATDALGPCAGLVLMEKDLHPGKTLKYGFPRDTTSKSSRFVSRPTAESIPFSSNKMEEILKRFSLRPESSEANTIKETIGYCEMPAMKGEERYCATSLESLVDFATSELGSNIRTMSTEMERGANNDVEQTYTITDGVKVLAEDKVVTCHKMSYPFAVFLCHAIEKTRAYMVPMEGADGTKANAVIICHRDTSKFAPNNWGLSQLHLKPGEGPLCHLLSDGHLTWLREKNLDEQYIVSVA
ncbi:BURP domain-containing protein 5-like [Pyrus x bretschneideri]|uniref:BURP domain-containing protein 5-like n=1 Tax=Pyrus x bretschneideri TaxID=225117 RepID=UPI00202E81D9|nr:BURP domain-containing protein 5-like [Pyrus x bretschneideri]